MKLCYWLRKKRYYRACLVDYEKEEAAAEEAGRLTESVTSYVGTIF